MEQAQIFRAIFRKASTQGLEISESINEELWAIQMIRRGPNRVPVKNVAWDVQATTKRGKTNVPVRPVGLGCYEASVSLSGHERLTLRVHDMQDDLLKVLHYHRAYPQEYALSGKVSEALETLPRFTEGGLREGLRPLNTRLSVASWFYLGALALSLVGLFLRRVLSYSLGGAASEGVSAAVSSLSLASRTSEGAVSGSGTVGSGGSLGSVRDSGMRRSMCFSPSPYDMIHES